jgi:tetratricopeptide (TPR) repeat protein
MGQTVLRLGDDERALTQFREALQLDDFLEYAHREMGEVYERQGDHERAVFEYKLAVKYSPESGRAKAALGYSLARAGDSREARRILGELATASSEKYVSPVFPATVHAGLEDNEEALNLLEQAYDRGDPALCDILRHPRFQSLYSHPRFRKLLQKMGLMAAKPAAVAG